MSALPPKDLATRFTPLPTSSRGKTLIEISLVCLTTLAILGAIYRPWGQRLETPLAYHGDVLYNAMLVRNLQTTEKYGISPLLAAPHGQNLSDNLYGGDRLQFLGLRLAGEVAEDPFVAVNLYFALGFLVVAVSAHLVARKLGLHPLGAGVIAVLFAFLPHHFRHGTNHLFLATYYSIPPAILLAVWSAW